MNSTALPNTNPMLFNESLFTLAILAFIVLLVFEKNGLSCVLTAKPIRNQFSPIHRHF